MKQVLIAFTLIFTSAYAMGQARDGTNELTKDAAQPAALIYLPYAPEVVQLALSNYLSKNSQKEQRDSKGFDLSENTLLVKNNISNASIYFSIGLREPSKLNQSVLYLKLYSYDPGVENSKLGEIHFDLQMAEDYLDNLAVAIKPYATDLQINLERKNISRSNSQDRRLINKGIKYEKEKLVLNKNMSSGYGNTSRKKMENRKRINQKDIDSNSFAKNKLEYTIRTQQAELALLIDQHNN